MISSRCTECNEMKYTPIKGQCRDCYSNVIKVEKQNSDVPESMINRAEKIIDKNNIFIQSDSYITHVLKIHSNKIIMEIDEEDTLILKKRDSISNLRQERFDSILGNALTKLQKS